MRAGTWDGRISAGTLSLGDAKLRNLAVPGGDSFTFTIPAGTTAPVPFKAPALHIPIPVMKETAGTEMWAVAGSLDLSPVTGTVNPATGAMTGSTTAHGILRLDHSDPGTAGASNSIYCQIGGLPASPDNPTPPAPFALSFASVNAWSGATGTATIRDTAFTVHLNCPFVTPDMNLRIVGHPVMPSGTNVLSLRWSFTRRPDPKSPAVVKCRVPKLTGMRLTKARKAAKKANCAIGTIKRKKSSRRSTTVLSQGRRVGTILAKGSKIKLTVAK